MKRTMKGILLLTVFVFPISIFVFLKIFGRNEFDVPVLYSSEAPPYMEGCPAVAAFPYVLPDSIRRHYGTDTDSLTVIFFGPLVGEEANQYDRLLEQTATERVRVIGSATSDPSRIVTEDVLNAGRDADAIRRCVFFLDGDTNVAMVDGQGAIRGQYKAKDREDMDRLLTEITIILKKY